jgi:hypothetical protein
VVNKYRLTKDEFEYYLTIPAPDGNRQVFYPFYVLSRPQAIASSWDWPHMLAWCADAFHLKKTMQQKAGLAEPELDPTILTYCVAHLFAIKSRVLKKSGRRQAKRIYCGISLIDGVSLLCPGGGMR